MMFGNTYSFHCCAFFFSFPKFPNLIYIINVLCLVPRFLNIFKDLWEKVNVSDGRDTFTQHPIIKTSIRFMHMIFFVSMISTRPFFRRIWIWPGYLLNYVVSVSVNLFAYPWIFPPETIIKTQDVANEEYKYTKEKTGEEIRKKKSLGIFLNWDNIYQIWYIRSIK